MAKEFIRVRSVKDIAVFTSLVVLGCVLVSLPAAPGVSLAGCFLVFSGIILSLFMKSGYKDSETGEKYFKKEEFAIFGIFLIMLIFPGGYLPPVLWALCFLSFFSPLLYLFN